MRLKVLISGELHKFGVERKLMQQDRRETSRFRSLGSVELSIRNRDEVPECLRVAAVRCLLDEFDPLAVQDAVEITHHVGDTRVITTLSVSEAELLMNLLSSATNAAR
jgi:hypothetical protein